MRYISLLFILLAGPVVGQTTTSKVSGPVLGYVFDSAIEGVRPIWGIPGAATLGEPLEFGRPLAAGAVSPQQDYVLATDRDGAVLLARLDTETLELSAVPEARSGAGLISLSPTGNAAALYHSGSNRIQIVTGLPGRPKLKADVDLSVLPGTLVSLAVADRGALVVLALVGDTGTLYLFEGHGEPRYLSAAGRAASMTFLANRDDLLLTDPAANTVSLVSNVGGAPEWTLLATEKDGLSAPVAAELSEDKLWVAHAGDVLILDRGGQSPVRLSCACTITGLERLRGKSTFRISPPSGIPMWVLDGDASAARVVFVPRLSAVTGSSALAPEGRN